MINRKLKAGDKPSKLFLTDIKGNLIEISKKSRQLQLLFFISPDCPACDDLMSALRFSIAYKSSLIEIILASYGEDKDHNKYIIEKELQQFPYIVSDVLREVYAVSILPYAVLIDKNGYILSTGVINFQEHLEEQLLIAIQSDNKL